MNYKMFRRSFSTVKENYGDQQTEDNSLEISVLKSKLNSKIQALGIMSKELDRCATERDRYKLLMEQISSIGTIDKNIEFFKARKRNGGELLAATRAENCALKVEVETLKSKLEEAQRDMAVLKQQIKTFQTIDSQVVSKKDENLTIQLEKVKKKYNQLKQDYNSTLDEKEELSADRDYYKERLNKINKQISVLMKNNNTNSAKNSPIKKIELNKQMVDSSNECEVLFEKIAQLEIENEMIKRNYFIYRENFEAKRKHGRFNYSFDKLDLETRTQVKNSIERNCGRRQLSLNDLSALCIDLVDQLSEKCYLLTHHKKCNRLLASRIHDLESTVETLLNGENYLPKFPSKMILEELCPEFVDPLLQDNGNNLDTLQEITEQELSDDDEEITLNTSTRDPKTKLPTYLEALVQKELDALKRKGPDGC